MLSDSLRDGLSELVVFTSLTNVPLSRHFLTGLLEGLTGLVLALFVLSALSSCIRFEVLGIKVGDWMTRHQIAMLQARRWRSSREHSPQASCKSTKGGHECPPKQCLADLDERTSSLRSRAGTCSTPTASRAGCSTATPRARAPLPLRLCAPVRERMPAEEAGPGPGDGLRWPGDEQGSKSHSGQEMV